LKQALIILSIESAIALAGWLFCLYYALQRSLHYLQLEDYTPTRMFSFGLKEKTRWLFGWELLAFPLLESWRWMQLTDHRPPLRFIYSLPVGDGAYFYLPGVLGLVLWGAAYVWRGRRLSRDLKFAKKPLVLTPRARRILYLGSALAAGVFIAFYAQPISPVSASSLLFMLAVERLAGLWMAAAVWILSPFEKFSQQRYLNDARRILDDVHPMVVGVTGSYGKTGTKELLAAMLADRYNLYRPPGSYNTLMGVTRAVREGLRPYHEAFIVEMGAYRRGSIARLCNLVHPLNGIVTAVGVQHLERFGSQSVIQQAKGELVRALPPEGVAVLNGDDPLCREMAQWRSGEAIFFSVEGSLGGRPIPPMFTDEGLLPVDVQSDRTIRADEAPLQAPGAKQVAARNIRITLSGGDFELHFYNGEVLPIHLNLLGRAAVSNACAAAAMADRLGVSRPGIARALALIPHVRHRLEPKTGEGGVTVIDDAYNSNPTGAATALEVLASATGGRRILVTPGMVELGKLEEEANRRFGRQAAKACDLVLLIGVKRIQPIREGLIAEGFSKEMIWIVPTLNRGLDKMTDWLKPGDVMLLENDLPDQYAGL